jgi:type II secretory pathway pseudopilin PulG
MYTARKTYRRGFSLIEMLVVLFVIMTMIGILMTALNSGQAEARRAVASQTMAAIFQSVTAYRMALDEIPPSDIDTLAAGYDENGKTFGVINSSLIDYQGGELLVQALIGPRPMTAPAPGDGKDGPGWIHRQHTYGPYLENIEDKIYLNSNDRWALQSPGTLLDDRPILYYAANPNATDDGRFGTGNAIWSDQGRYDLDHNTTLIPTGEDPTNFWNTTSLDPDRRDFEMSLRSNTYMLVSVGESGIYGEQDNVQRAYK